MTLKEETITPTYARELLAQGYKNRQLNQNKVLEYAVAIEKNLWSPTASKIDIDEKGKLINGGHRLEACILANKPFTTLVHRGVPTSDRDVIDTGEKRKLTDLMAMYTQRTNVINYAACLNKCLDLLSRKAFKRPRVQTLDAMRRWVPIFEEGIDYTLGQMLTKGSGWNERFRNGYVTGAFAFAYKRNPAKVKQFLQQVVHGENISAKDPSFTIRSMILNLGDKEGRSLTKVKDVPYKILSGIYCMIKEQPYTKAQISTEAVDYFIEAYDTAQVKNLLDPYIKLTVQREANMKKLTDAAKKSA
jgi:hypothetical protein